MRDLAIPIMTMTLLSACSPGHKGRSKRIQRARVDKDLDIYRSWVGLHLITLGMPTTASELAAFADGLTLWGDKPGVALLAEVRVQRTHPTALSGTVNGWKVDSTLFQITVSGTWRAEQTELFVDWGPYASKELDEKYDGYTERIRLDQLDKHNQGSWFSSPDWCNA